MKKSLFRKGLVLGIIVLFIGASGVSGVNRRINDLSNDFTKILDDVEDTVDVIEHQVISDGPCQPLDSSFWWNPDWLYRKQITIDHTLVDDDLTNFPVLVSNISLDYVDHAQTDGDDFVFISSDSTTKYNHEIELYNSATGELVAWVNVTSLSSSVDTTIYMYYGNSEASNQQNVTGTWDNDYKLVCHLDDEASTVNDSTGNSNNGIKKGDTEPARTTGKTGYGQNQDGGDDYIDWGNIGDTFYGFSLWIKPNSIIDKNSPSKGFLNVRTNYLYAIFGSCTSLLEDEVFTIMKAYGGDTRIATTDDITAAWHLVTASWDGDRYAIYLDGSLATIITAGGATPQQTMENLRLGRFAATNCQDMDIDEFRVFINSGRSTAWINTSYNTMNDPDSFLSVGEEELDIIPPVANFTYSPSNPTTQDNIQFTDTSTDVDGTIMSWHWDFGDGNISNLQNPTHQYSNPDTYTVTLNVTDDDGATDEISKNVTVVNIPPNTPRNPSPTNHATDVDINANLYWLGGDPDPGDTVTYDVYFGTSSSPPKVATGQSGTIYNPGTMSYSTKYYWKIISWDNHGASTTGPIWDFTTGSEPNDPPNPPSDPSPEDDAINVSINTLLGWTCSDPDGDPLVYDVYLEADDPTPDILVSDDQTGTTYNPGGLEYTTTYYWQIIAKDSHSATTSGPIWSFTTEETTPDLDCDGTLSWTNVIPGSTVTNFISIENIGEPDSLLDWEIDDYPNWGTWTFTPSSGDDLLPNNPVTVGVTVIAPDEPETEFTGEVKIVNSEDPDDYCIIDVSLATPVNQQVINPLLHMILERFPNAFPILRHLMGL